MRPTTNRSREFRQKAQESHDAAIGCFDYAWELVGGAQDRLEIYGHADTAWQWLTWAAQCAGSGASVG